MSNKLLLLRLSACLLPVLAAAPATAAELGGGFSLTGDVTVVSDYRFRGISLSDEDPAVQAGLTLEHGSGFYFGIWGSSLDDTPTYGEIELNFFAGWTGEIAANTTVDVGLLYYYYPDGDSAFGNSDFFEPYASITHDFGPVAGTVGVNYAWSQSATGNGDNIYIYTDWSAPIPNTPVSLNAHLGYSDGSLSPTGSYLDWSLGASVEVGPATLGLAYVDTDLGGGPGVDSAVVLSLSLGF